MAKWHREDDPCAAREAQKYERPIPSREYILHFITERGVPVSFSRLVDEFGLEESVDQVALQRRLRAMERDGQLMENRRGEYGLLNKMNLVTGRVTAHRDGFGFLIPDQGGADLFLSPRQMRGLLHGDRAVVRVTGIDRRGRREGTLVEVLERNTRRLVGRFFREKGGIGFVIPDNKHIHQNVLVPPDQAGDAREGQIVVADLTEQPSKHTQPIGRIVEVLGEHMAPGMEIDIAIRVHGLPDHWPADVLEEVGQLTPTVAEADKSGREDLRHLAFVTIDGPDAQDFDDAVYCERTPKGWKLYVAIADVSAYVSPGTALDAEAQQRGTSVYFPGRVIPMLPEILSNGLCSLKPQEDRLCLVSEMFINREGDIVRSRFSEGLLRSRQRFTYDEVAAILVQQDPAVRGRHSDLLPPLEELYALYQVLRAARERRGALDFESTETRIVFGPERKIARLEPLVRNDAHRIIEECMVAANVAAARFLKRHKIPALYRVHDRPTLEKVSDLRAFLGELGLRLGGGERPENQYFAALLAEIEGRPDAHLIQTVVLRSLAQALYSPMNIGHFGLALGTYTHFTSPIRRFPDLLVHRAIRHVLRGGSPAEFPLRLEQMTILGDHCSMAERRADEATRDAIGWLKCEFMLDKVGEVFPGIISAVTSFGLFVELDDIYVEGLVHISALGNDYYHFDPIHHRLQGERTRVIYRLGDPLTVRVVRVALDDRKIDFEIAEEQAAQAAVPQRRRRRSRYPRRRAR